MNVISNIYCDILEESREPVDKKKKYLKDLIQENIPDIAFMKSSQRNKPDQPVNFKSE